MEGRPPYRPRTGWSRSLRPFVSRCDDFVLLIVLLLVIGRSDHDQDYEQEQEDLPGRVEDGLHIDESVEPPFAQLAAEAALLHAAERQRGFGSHGFVDADATGGELP